MAARERMGQQYFEHLKQARRQDQCKEWALRPQGLLLLLTPQEEAPLQDVDPICWRVNARFAVDRTQDTIFLRDHFL